MKLRIPAAIGALFVSVAFCHANIIGNTLAADGDGVLSCSVYGLQPIDTGGYQLSIDGTHHVFGSGDILGDIITDTDTDPSLTLLHSIDNDTGFIWTDYHVEITMNKSFTITGATVGNNLWYANVTAPTLMGSDWIGYVDYYSGDPVPNLGTLDFGYTLTFSGSVAFAETLTPTGVPEPTTALFVICGLVGLYAFQRRRLA